MDPGVWQIPELLIFTGKDWLKTLVEKTSVKSREIVVDFISNRLSQTNIHKTHIFGGTCKEINWTRPSFISVENLH